MKNTPFLIYSNSEGAPLEAVDPSGATYNEKWLQELLRLHPNILPAGEIEPVFTPLKPIGREVPVTAGYIDNLFISPQGFIR